MSLMNTLISILLALGLHLLFEAPFTNLEKMFFASSNKSDGTEVKTVHNNINKQFDNSLQNNENKQTDKTHYNAIFQQRL